ATLVERERVCRVATVSPQGVPHAVPVCHVLADGKLYFASETGARKVRNIRKNPHVTVTVDLYSEDWSSLKGVMIQGSAALLVNTRRCRQVRKLLYEKYPQSPEFSPIGDSDSLVVEVTPTNVFAWGF